MIKPMLCKLQTEPFDNPSWLWERKYDGARMLAFTSNSGCRLQARSGTNKTTHFPDLNIHTTLPAILDGEVVSAAGLSFQDGIQPRINRIYDQDTIAEILPAKYMVFDALQLNGQDLRLCSLMERKRILSGILIPDCSVELVGYSFYGVSTYEYAKSECWEGIVGKQIDSMYRENKRDWVKIKVWQEGIYTAVDRTVGTGRREHLFGALFLTDDDDEYVGSVGTGFTDQQLAELLTYRLPFRVRIKYLEVTNKGLLRFPVFVSKI